MSRSSLRRMDIKFKPDISYPRLRLRCVNQKW